MSTSKDPLGESLPISRLIPNVVTIIGLCFGLFALKYAIAGKWEMAVIFIVIATFIDGLDGSLARMLNASSSFGAQLDSLADFFNFGVAPALVLYMWRAHDIKGLGWAVTLFFIISMALRLARFNASSENSSTPDDPEVSGDFFKGIPAPCGAGLSLIPIMLTFLFESKFGYQVFEITPIMVIVYMALIAVLMVSAIPTISMKKVKIKHEMIYLVLAGAGIFIIALVLEPWVVLPVMGIGYLATIPFSVFAFYKGKNR